MAQVNIAIGWVFGIAGGAAEALAGWIFKRAIRRKLASEATATPDTPPHLKIGLTSQPWWYIGLALMFFGELLILLPTRVATQPNPTAVGQVTALVTGIVISKWALKEPIAYRDLFGYFAMLVGACFSFYQVETTTVSLPTYILYAFIVLILVIVLYFAIWMTRRRLGTTDLGDASAVGPRKALPLLYAGFMSFLQFFILVPVVLITTFSRIGALNLIVVAAGFVASIFAQIYWYHITLNKYDLFYVLAMFFMMRRAIELIFTASFGGWKNVDLVRYIVLPAIGLAIELFAGYILSLRENFSAYHLIDAATPNEGFGAGPNDIPAPDVVVRRPPAAAAADGKSSESDSSSSDLERRPPKKDDAKKEDDKRVSVAGDSKQEKRKSEVPQEAKLDKAEARKSVAPEGAAAKRVSTAEPAARKGSASGSGDGAVFAATRDAPPAVVGVSDSKL